MLAADITMELLLLLQLSGTPPYNYFGLMVKTLKR